MKRGIWVLFGMIVLTIIGITLISLQVAAQGSLSIVVPEIDPLIIEWLEIENKSEAPVQIAFKDTGNERLNKEILSEFFLNVSFFVDIPASRGRVYLGFLGNLSKEGLDKLRITNKSNIIYVDFDRRIFAKKITYSLDKLIITFSGETKDNISAVTKIWPKGNTTAHIKSASFKEYFLNDLKNITAKIANVNKIDISSWDLLVDCGTVKIEYVESLSDEEKSKSLNEIKTKLESKWYTVWVGHNIIGIFLSEEIEKNHEDKGKITSTKLKWELWTAIPFFILTVIIYLIIKKRKGKLYLGLKL